MENLSNMDLADSDQNELKHEVVQKKIIFTSIVVLKLFMKKILFAICIIMICSAIVNAQSTTDLKINGNLETASQSKSKHFLIKMQQLIKIQRITFWLRIFTSILFAKVMGKASNLLIME